MYRAFYLWKSFGVHCQSAFIEHLPVWGTVTQYFTYHMHIKNPTTDPNKSFHIIFLYKIEGNILAIATIYMTVCIQSTTNFKHSCHQWVGAKPTAPYISHNYHNTTVWSHHGASTWNITVTHGVPLLVQRVDTISYTRLFSLQTCSPLFKQGSKFCLSLKTTQ